MGADYDGQDRAIAELSALSLEAKRFLNHHLGNSLSAVINGICLGNLKLAEAAAFHILEDLELAGIRDTRAALQRAVHEAEYEKGIAPEIRG